MWSLLKAGKYAGRSLPQILFMDPDYFFWAVKNKVFQGRLATEAAKLSWKARHIKIPKPILKIGVLNISSRLKTNSHGTNLSTPSGRDM
jgi:hypothetical protein